MSSMHSPAVETRRSSLWGTLATLFVVAVLFNYLWELAQAPLYVGMTSFRTTWWHCFRASLGDGLLVLIIFAAGWAVRRRSDWFVHPGVCGYIIMLAIGLAIGAWGCSSHYRHYRYREAAPYGYYGGSGTYGPPYGGRYERRDWDGRQRYRDYDR